MTRHCVFCDEDIDDWLPFTKIALSPFVLKVEVVGSDLRRFYCPNCGSKDRERHLKLFFDRLGLWPLFRGTILHFAPEGRLSKTIRRLRPALYIRADLQPQQPEVEKIDIESIPYPAASFDALMCNHVLEHVSDPQRALAEIHRVLKPGGRLICQTPYARRLSSTLEDPLLQSEDDRIFFYAQHNHLRLFGLDIEDVIRQAGFAGALRPHRDALADIDPEAMGVNEDEPFFDFIRV